MTTLFISDLHLCKQRPDITEMFKAFLDNKARHARALYILGDLFEYWLGDDALDETALQVATWLKALNDAGVDIIAVSADAKHQAEEQLEKLDISFPIAYGLTEEQMKTLGVYISLPRSEQETDHNFAEPGLFVVNEKGELHVVDVSNNPFVRPELGALTRGLAWIRDPNNHYPIRGTLDY